ncbi:Acyl-CoA N-acyltransferase with RING/FYVE/PHD-type zinc finger domain isoform 1 [Dorcoceras hygrometricum]|uniref:Acyl-CoA N-acyltransferase with RING/FYVE/PHD-type zinc finger domain isoform 1 n=1 Tax=Dorcoceras hygrometricum TaxID=472368 RepID=A0A2Z7D5L0_9LAMI|nr:Acyl-CoA N-acyltransferase with RING/FYVE/PHD-type zinc finger domain isoform 1 [Dorcoceras hygrometricum]
MCQLNCHLLKGPAPRPQPLRHLHQSNVVSLWNILYLLYAEKLTTGVRKLEEVEKIEHAGPLGSLGLNGAGETADEFFPTGSEDI